MNNNKIALYSGAALFVGTLAVLIGFWFYVWVTDDGKDDCDVANACGASKSLSTVVKNCKVAKTICAVGKKSGCSNWNVTTSILVGVIILLIAVGIGYLVFAYMGNRCIKVTKKQSFCVDECGDPLMTSNMMLPPPPQTIPCVSPPPTQMVMSAMPCGSALIPPPASAVSAPPSVVYNRLCLKRTAAGC